MQQEKSEQTHESEIHHFYGKESHKNTKNCNTYVEDLVETYVGAVLADLVYVSSHAPCLVVLLVFSIPSDSCNLSASSSNEFTEF